MIGRFLVAIALLTAGLAPRVAAAAEPGDLQLVRLAPVPQAAPRGIASEPGLAETDIALYAEIFALERKGRFDRADELIGKIADRRLLGHVMAERFLGPHYRAPWAELAAWLRRYADHPQAERIYALALKRRPDGAPPPPPPLRQGQVAAIGDIAQSLALLKDGTSAERKPSAEVESWRRKIADLVRAGEIDKARRMLAEPQVPAGASAFDRDLAAEIVAEGLLRRGRPLEAMKLAYPAATRSGAREPELHWTTGNAAWQAKEWAIAARQFGMLANHAKADDERRAAAAFWSARASLAAGRPQVVGMYLRQAANGADPFYAMLARAVLGQDTTVPPTGSTRRLAALAMLQASAGGSRALALGQIGEAELAMSEIRHLAPQADARLGSALDWLAHELESADADETELELRRGAQGVFYPLPRWKPRNGYKIDRALVYAVIHSESSFDPRARSRAGAIGLMQVLPETAALLAKVGKTRQPSVGELFEPETNLRYGQAYLAYLMGKPRFGDNLIYTIAAYNAGPVRVEAWIDAFGAKTDPLAFIETIPVAETRSYVKRVLTAYWIYEARLERSSPSLHALAENRWPRYPKAAPSSKSAPTKLAKSDARR